MTSTFSPITKFGQLALDTGMPPDDVKAAEGAAKTLKDAGFTASDQIDKGTLPMMGALSETQVILVQLAFAEILKNGADGFGAAAQIAGAKSVLESPPAPVLTPDTVMAELKATKHPNEALEFERFAFYLELSKVEIEGKTIVVTTPRLERATYIRITNILNAMARRCPSLENCYVEVRFAPDWDL